tara:strand:- start:1373 stop:2833 length:1461 start_codon:yes stop_codon:yes gene_type:complete
MAIKIPTYTAQGRPTTEIGAVKSTSQISPTGGVAGALLPAANQVAEFALQKRNIAEKTESVKIVNTIKGDIDKTIQQNKDNINEDDAINKLQKSYQTSKDSKLANIKNRRVRERVNNLLDIEYSEYVNTVKKNSYNALEKDTIKVTNDGLNIIIGKYSTEKDLKKRKKYEEQGIKSIKELSRDFKFPKNKEEDHIKKFKKNLLSGDFIRVVKNSRNVDLMKSIDDSLGGEKTTSNEEFAAISYNSIQTRINELTVVGDENANFNEARDLIENYEKLERSNGFKPSTVLKNKIASIKESINKQEVQHENIINKIGENKSFYDFSKDAKTSLLKSITDKKLGIPATLEDRLIANEIEAEYDQMINDYIDGNPEATLENKKSFVRNLTSTLNNIYQDRKISRIKSRSFTEDTFDIVAEKNRVMKDAKLLAQGQLDALTVKRYRQIAKAQGYVTKITENGKTITVGDIGAFLNDYLPILKKQVTATQVTE